MLLALLVSVCLAPCSEDSEPEAQVVATQVRPGLIVVQNACDARDTLRIVQEYDRMRGGGSAHPHQYPEHAAIPEAANTKASYTQPSCPQYYCGPQTFPPSSINSQSETLIDLHGEDLCNPPPYAPRSEKDTTDSLF